jgi:2-polyprenyl-6-methoxyphenol hydroxylase-like FAD-dependent oxidoreductase
MSSTDVLVIGAGPVGLTLACELKRHGVGVRLIERKAERNEHANAAVVHVRTLEILCAMGAVEGFLREGYALPGGYPRMFGRRIGFVEIGGVDSPFSRPRTIAQHVTERLLEEHFQRLGGRVERSVEAMGMEQDGKEVRVRLRHLAEGNREEVVTAGWVAGCEGSKSITRETAQISFEGKRYVGKEFLQVDAKVRWSHPQGFAYMFLERDHIVICLPYDDQGFYRIICGRDDRDPESHEPPTLEEMQAILQQHADPATELYDPTWFNHFRSGHRFAGRFRDGRAFIAGDAGHVHVPIGGQGMNYGMHDAFNLGWKLAAVIKGEAKPKLLESYEAERLPVDKALVRLTDRAFEVLMRHSRALGRTMKIIGPALLGMSAVQHRFRNTLAELEVAYPASELSEDHEGSGGPAAGDRAPDALVVRMPERQTAHLFDVLHGTRWTLLLFAGPNPDVPALEGLERISAALSSLYGTRLAIHLILCGDPPVPVRENWAAHLVMDREQDAHGKYGVEATPCLYLVRPDWYIGFRGGMEYHLHLARYLERVLT